MSEKSLAQKVFDKMMSLDHCSQWMGIKPVLIEEGHCIVEMRVRQEMLNGYGILHGGMAYAFADSAFAFASNSYGRIAVSITGTMSYSKPAKEGDLLRAEARALNVGYKTAEFDVDVSLVETSEVLYRFRGMVYRKSETIESR